MERVSNNGKSDARMTPNTSPPGFVHPSNWCQATFNLRESSLSRTTWAIWGRWQLSWICGLKMRFQLWKSSFSVPLCFPIETSVVVMFIYIYIYLEGPRKRLHFSCVKAVPFLGPLICLKVAPGTQTGKSSCLCGGHLGGLVCSAWKLSSRWIQSLCGR